MNKFIKIFLIVVAVLILIIGAIVGYFLFGGLTRDDVKEIVTDIRTDLMWQDTKESKSLPLVLEDAFQYCEESTHAGFSDWQLPSALELESIANWSTKKRPIKSVFLYHKEHSHYWTRHETTVKFPSAQEWLGIVGSNYVRCVRKNI